MGVAAAVASPMASCIASRMASSMTSILAVSRRGMCVVHVV
jgi:hypothetical protein